MWDYMYSLDMMVVLICHVDLLHATVDVNGTLLDLNRFFLYQTPVVELEVARVVHSAGQSSANDIPIRTWKRWAVPILSTIAGWRELYAVKHQHILSRPIRAIRHC
jgi:hypothetical protein